MASMRLEKQKQDERRDKSPKQFFHTSEAYEFHSDTEKFNCDGDWEWREYHIFG